MSFSTIGIGAAPDDGTGDTFRTAFGKVNSNFALVPPMSAIYLAADSTGSNGTTAQNVFSTPSQITLDASSTYEIDGLYHIDCTGVNAYYISVLFAGTATYSSIVYSALASEVVGAFGTMGGYFVRATAATAIQVAGNASGPTKKMISIRGLLRTTAGGTIIPQFIYSNTPGAAPTTKAGSFFRVQGLGASSITSFGSGVS